MVDVRFEPWSVGCISCILTYYTIGYTDLSMIQIYKILFDESQGLEPE